MVKFRFAGRYNDDPESLITHPHKPNNVPFKEAPDMKKLSIIMNGLALLIRGVEFKRLKVILNHVIDRIIF